MSDVTERYSGSAPAVRKAIEDAMAGVTVAKEAVSLEAISGVKTRLVEQSKPASKETTEATAPKKVATKESARKAVKKSATKKTIPAPAKDGVKPEKGQS